MSQHGEFTIEQEIRYMFANNIKKNMFYLMVSSEF